MARGKYKEEGELFAPVNGKIETLESLDDGMFSEKVMIVTSENEIADRISADTVVKAGDKLLDLS